MSSVIVAKASVIPAFKFVISGTGVENTLSFPIKRSQGGNIRRSWWPGCRTISPNPLFWKCCIQKPTNMWTPVLSCTILLENYRRNGKKKKYVCIPHSFLVIYVCNHGKTLCSPCINTTSGICHLHRVTNTRYRINTIDSPDDEHRSARNMCRIGINIYEKRTVRQVGYLQELGTELNWTELNWTELNWTELNWTWHVKIALRNFRLPSRSR